MSYDFLEEFLARDGSFLSYSDEESEGGEMLQFEEEAAVGKLLNGLVSVERCGVPNGI